MRVLCVRSRNQIYYLSSVIVDSEALFFFEAVNSSMMKFSRLNFLALDDPHITQKPINPARRLLLTHICDESLINKQNYQIKNEAALEL